MAKIPTGFFHLQAFLHHTVDNQSFVFQDLDVVRISKRHRVRKLADLGKPGTVNHAVELELRMPQRDTFRVVLPYLVANMLTLKLREN